VDELVNRLKHAFVFHKCLKKCSKFIMLSFMQGLEAFLLVSSVDGSIVYVSSGVKRLLNYSQVGRGS
jgi:hypothetical protein